MKRFNLTFRGFALIASTMFVSGQQCDLPSNVQFLVNIPGYESVESLYCFSDATVQGFLDYAVGLAIEKESTSPGFIEGCFFQLLPNFQNEIAQVSYPECPPPGEPSPLSLLSTAIEPTYFLNDGFLYSLTQAYGDGAWCVNFDICNRDDFTDYMIGATTFFSQGFGGEYYITSFQTFKKSCFENILNPLTCSDETISDCDNKLLLDVTIGSDEPFSMAICDDECNESTSKSPDVLNILSYANTKSDRFCLPEGTTTSAEYSSRAFELDKYCDAEEIKARDGNCIKAKSSKASKTEKVKSSKGAKDQKAKSSKGSKSEKAKSEKAKSSKGLKRRAVRD